MKWLDVYAAGKGTKIAQLAKEKVQKYKDENVSLQQQLDQMKSDAGTPSAEAHRVVMTTASSELLVSIERVEVDL